MLVKEPKFGVKSFEVAGRLNLNLALGLSNPSLTVTRQVCHECHHKAMNLIKRPLALCLGMFCSPINPLTTDDAIWHQTLAACYQLAQSVLKIGSALAERVGQGEVGGCTTLADSAWRRLQLPVEKPWSMPGGPFVCFLAQTGVENASFTL